jgi:hypothetical protein
MWTIQMEGVALHGPMQVPAKIDATYAIGFLCWDPKHPPTSGTAFNT